MGAWTSFIISRLVAMVLVACFLVVATFGMVRLIPGDPVVAILGVDATPQAVEVVRNQLGLDLPLEEQFLAYVRRLATGDLGNSFRNREPVASIIASRVGNSLQLGLVSVTLVLGLAVPLGVIAGAITREKRHPKIEVGYQGLAVVIGSLPEFLMATFLAFLFGVWLRVLPIAGAGSWAHLVLPALAVSLRPIWSLSRIIRVQTLDILAQDYIRTARSKRLPPRFIYFRHVLPNVLTYALTVGGLLISGIIAGAVIVENVFARPGVGTALVQGIISRDYPVVQSFVLLIGIAVVFVNSTVDALLRIFDPRTLAGKG